MYDKIDNNLLKLSNIRINNNLYYIFISIISLVDNLLIQLRFRKGFG